MKDPNRCKICQKRFSSEELLERHHEIKHQEELEIKELEPFSISDLIYERKAFFAASIILGLFLLAGLTVQSMGESPVRITVVTCEECDYNEFRETTDPMIPTSYSEVMYNSSEGEKLINRYDLNYVPGFIFSKNIENTENFTRMRSVLVEFDDAYVLPDRGVRAAQRTSEGMALNRSTS